MATIGNDDIVARPLSQKCRGAIAPATNPMTTSKSREMGCMPSIMFLGDPAKYQGPQKARKPPIALSRAIQSHGSFGSFMVCRIYSVRLTGQNEPRRGDMKIRIGRRAGSIWLLAGLSSR